MKNIIVVSGGFDPLHSGHIKLFNSAKSYGDYLIVGVNSDNWLSRKKERAFMPFFERAAIVSNIKVVDEVMEFNDDDNTACDLLELVKAKYPGYSIAFANGGDRTNANVPEMSVTDVKFLFGVGGDDKANSSSWILNEWKSPKTQRSWGWYRVLDSTAGYKVKELIINPNSSLSMQRHFKRSEHWYVLKGECILETRYNGTVDELKLSTNESFKIEKEVWHQAKNLTTYPCHILEVQYGEQCVEEDIERV